MFQIYNKDFSEYSKGKPNLHTMYWKALFDEDNLKDVVYKLNGQGEIFYRKKSITEENIVKHNKGDKLEHRNPLRKDKKSVFEYDIVKDRRYTVDKIMLHVPITMNFKAKGINNINHEVYRYLKGNPDVNIIGIDRGERHLLYISVIDRNGKVLKDENGKYLQYSLNEITGEYKTKNGEEVKFITPYKALLDEREVEREKARENWETIEKIKELKEGYMSQVIHHLTYLMIKYNAIIVMENLNSGFKNSRKKVEKQVYQNFEKALINKLNYYVNKDIADDHVGGIYQALQLTNEFKSFQELGKQSGFIFYVPAWNTSKIDPVTGFVDLLKPKYTNINNAKEFFSRFERISYNRDKDWFEFVFDYSEFTEKATGTKTNWTLCTYGAERYAYNRSLNNNRGGEEKWNLTEKLKNLFAEYHIDYGNGDDMVKDIDNVSDAKFYIALIKILQVLLAMRYSCKEDKRDFILSPVMDDKGNFFNSEESCLKDIMPQDADANGAFNIARKGLWVLEQIDKSKDEKDWTTAISNKQWLDYVQTRFHYEV